jgi:hypothetical protein
MPVTLATEIKRLMMHSQPREIVCETLFFLVSTRV